MATSIMTVNTGSSISGAMRQAAKTTNLKSRSNSKYFPSYNTKKSHTSQTSLLDVIRSQGPRVLGMDEHFEACRRPSTDLMTTQDNLPSQPTSKPIRIAPPRHSSQEGVEEEICSNSAELERFYDQATWRMYVLIQSARVANDQAPRHGRVPTTSHSHAQYSTQPLQPPSHYSSRTIDWATQRPAGSFIDDEEEKEDIFDFEL